VSVADQVLTLATGGRSPCALKGAIEETVRLLDDTLNGNRGASRHEDAAIVETAKRQSLVITESTPFSQGRPEAASVVALGFIV